MADLPRRTALPGAALAFVLIAVPACRGERGDPSFAESCSGMAFGTPEYRACADSAERTLVGSSGGDVYRKGGALHFRTASGGEVVLRDDTTGAGCLRQRYRGRLSSLGYFVVRREYCEGFDWLLIGKAPADSVTLDGPPVVAPDGRHFVTTSLDLDVDHMPNRVQLWHVTLSRPMLEWSAEGDFLDWGPSDAHWESPSVLTFTRIQRTEGRGVRTSPVRVEWNGSSWIVTRGSIAVAQPMDDDDAGLARQDSAPQTLPAPPPVPDSMPPDTATRQ